MEKLRAIKKHYMVPNDVCLAWKLSGTEEYFQLYSKTVDSKLCVWCMFWKSKDIAIKIKIF